MEDHFSRRLAIAALLAALSVGCVDRASSGAPDGKSYDANPTTGPSAKGDGAADAPCTDVGIDSTNFSGPTATLTVEGTVEDSQDCDPSKYCGSGSAAVVTVKGNADVCVWPRRRFEPIKPGSKLLVVSEELLTVGASVRIACAISQASRDGCPSGPTIDAGPGDAQPDPFSGSTNQGCWLPSPIPPCWRRDCGNEPVCFVLVVTVGEAR